MSIQEKQDETAALVCPECGAPMVLRETKKYLYKDGTPRKFFGCSQFPRCKATHGAHPDGKPVGVPGDLETKKARRRAHSAFDKLWKIGDFKRKQTYGWVARRLGVKILHIGEMDIEQCEKVVQITSEKCREEGWE